MGPILCGTVSAGADDLDVYALGKQDFAIGNRKINAVPLAPELPRSHIGHPRAYFRPHMVATPSDRRPDHRPDRSWRAARCLNQCGQTGTDHVGCCPAPAGMNRRHPAGSSEQNRYTVCNPHGNGNPRIYRDQRIGFRAPTNLIGRTQHRATVHLNHGMQRAFSPQTSHKRGTAAFVASEISLIHAGKTVGNVVERRRGNHARSLTSPVAELRRAPETGGVAQTRIRWAAMLLLLLACDSGTSDDDGTGAADTGPVADYTLSLLPLVPSNINPFDGVDRIDLVFNSGTGEPTRVSLDAPSSGSSAQAEGLPALDGTVLELEGYAAGELVAWGQSAPVSAETAADDHEVSIFVGRPNAVGWLGSLPDETALGQAAALGDGKFVVLGGLANKNNGSLGKAGAAIFTLDLGQPNDALDWELADEEMPNHTDGDGEERRERASGTLTPLTTGNDSGKFLLAGGCDGEPIDGATSATPDVQIFDADTMKFEPIGAADILVSARCGHAAIGRTDGSVLVWGGWGFTGSSATILAITAGELYDPEDREFSTVNGPSDAGSHGVALAELGEDGTMVAGGILIDDYDGDGYADWKTTSRSFRITLRGDAGSESYAGLDAVAGHAMTTLPGGDILSFGGATADSGGLQLDELADATAKVWRFYQSSSSWIQVGSMRLPRAGHSATLINETDVLLVGGSDSWSPTAHAERAYSCVEVYDIVANSSTMLNGCDADADAGGLSNRSEMPMTLFDSALGVLVAGGLDGDAGAQRGSALYSLPR